MPGSAAQSVITGRQHMLLRHLAAAPTRPVRLAQRAEISPRALAGAENPAIAPAIGLDPTAVGWWRRRWVTARPQLIPIACTDTRAGCRRAIDDVRSAAPRRGHPGASTPEQVTPIRAPAGAPPEPSGRPSTHRTDKGRADAAAPRGLGASLAEAPVGRSGRAAAWPPPKSRSRLHTQEKTPPALPRGGRTRLYPLPGGAPPGRGGGHARRGHRRDDREASPGACGRDVADATRPRGMPGVRVPAPRHPDVDRQRPGGHRALGGSDVGTRAHRGRRRAPRRPGGGDGRGGALGVRGGRRARPRLGGAGAVGGPDLRDRAGVGGKKANAVCGVRREVAARLCRDAARGAAWCPCRSLRPGSTRWRSPSVGSGAKECGAATLPR